MSNKWFTKILPYMIISSLILSSCGYDKVDCNNPNAHAHLYTKDVDGHHLARYAECEYDYVDGWEKHEDFMDINKYDQEYLHALDEGEIFGPSHLFEGKKYFGYLYDVMANNNDYLEFQYEYEVTHTTYTYDSNNKPIPHTTTTTEYAWHKKQSDKRNTGKVRLCHYQYFAYDVVEYNGQYRLMRSNSVDDIREVLDDYPYAAEGCWEVVKTNHKVNKHHVKDLTPEDFIEDYNHPDLENKTWDLHKKRTR